MRRATSNSGRVPRSCAARESGAKWRRATRSIAKGDWPGPIPYRFQTRTGMASSFCPSLLDFPERFLSELDIFESQFASADEVSHDRTRVSTEHGEQVVHQPALRGLTGNNSFKHVEVPDLADTAHDFLVLHAIDGLLHGGVTRPFFLRKRLLHLSNGGVASRPERLHDLHLESR